MTAELYCQAGDVLDDTRKRVLLDRIAGYLYLFVTVF
jgi:hypothetical protein